MKRMKTFLIYAVLVIIVILATDFIANIILETGYKPVKYEITTTSPKISITQAETTNANGRIKGSVTNETTALIEGSFIKIELLSNIGNKLGTEYIQVGNLQPSESKEFEMKYRYSDVDNIVFSITNEKTEEILEYHTLIEHAGTYYKIARLITFTTYPSIFFLIALFIK